MRIVRLLLVLVSFFLAAISCLGGAVLIAEAHENPLGTVPQLLLATSPFRSILFQGIHLFGAVGLFGIWTLWVNLRENPNSGLWSALEGVLLMSWVLVWGTPLWLHYACCVPAMALIASGLGLQINGLMRSRTRKESPH